MKQRILTGITTSGTPHLGNYAGAIRPAIKNSNLSNIESFFFLADYHALVKCQDANRIHQSCLQLAATWLASGLNPEKVIFYRQSDVIEITELSWILTCVTNKGLMNRAHAYKSLIDQNILNGLDKDYGINMGLYNYPILMAADILLFKANRIPVGRDQLQHIEIARDIAIKFNNIYEVNYFVLPEAYISKDVEILPGLDGRKMSKSYNNTIPLFECNSKDLYKYIMSIVTDSSKPGEYKESKNSIIYLLYKAFSNHEDSSQFYKDLNQGMSWKEAKLSLFNLINREIEPMREKYIELISKPSFLKEILLNGAKKAKIIAQKNINQVKEIIGINDF
ncbi:Tryptophan--tRNA ligase [Candidatus Kinetoplastibacterium sorsogonicusi]|uniref:Tryptophan--tRNA ligase n=1 Tax=Candidatus Kinetoplastidibacterium kentomonadis TaxID=1576550 RepID=A0A3S7JA53_9PROT|nr:tryptophan--tRNA ligase [Candidatus Kinetoplastibacterium sorsogonicusi]AWD32536.1 Tryptophan--tRNA ligase [Candidatus Kinetoplastibacterium sorsogonicusi]